MISKRAGAVDVSGIRKVFALAGSMKNPIDLSLGQPDFEAFPDLKDEAKAAIDRGDNRYLPTQGLPALRSKIAEQYALPDEFDVMITAGVTGALALSYLTLLDVGDEILIPDPYFVVYKELATLLGLRIRYYDLYPDFITTAERIAAALGPETKAVVVNSPGNPTGTTIPESELRAIEQLCRERAVPLIYDEIYDAFCFDEPHPRCVLDPGTIISNGFSKTYGIPGWRLGYLIATKELISIMSTVQQYSFVCGNSVGQVALSKIAPVDFAQLLESYRQRRDFVYENLKEYYDVVKPGGAFYIFPKAPGGDAQKFLTRCLQQELLIVPGNAFSRSNTHFRISFSASMAQLERGVEVLQRLAS
jgi:aspartate/methionine/tyrosine aminotransferase